MRRIMLALLVSAAALAGAGARPAFAGKAHATQAVFVATNQLDGNRVDAFARAADGTLTTAGSYATGGLGGAQDGAVVDKLASQGALTYDAAHALLFAVNAGSDSLSVFSVDGTSLALRQVIDTGGAFPSSVAVHGRFVYVLNAGGAGSVQGFHIDGNAIHPLHDGHRALGLANADPPFFLTSPGQVGFSPDGSQLLVTTKGSTNSFEVFAVHADGSLAAAPVIDAAATPAPFAFTFVDGRLVSAEAGASILSTYALGADGTLSGAKSQGDGQAALCWVTSAGRFVYVANAGSASISGYTVGADGTPTLIGVVGSTEAGAIDLAATSDGAFLYGESGGAGTLDEFAVNGDGTLSKLGVIAGLPAGLEGIAVT